MCVVHCIAKMARMWYFGSTNREIAKPARVLPDNGYVLQNENGRWQFRFNAESLFELG